MQKTFIIAIVVCALALTGCGKRSADKGNTVIAKVSNKTITIKDFKDRIAKMPKYYQDIIDKNPRRYLEDMIMEMIFLEEAVRKGIDKDQEVRDLVTEAKKKIIITRFIKSEVDEKAQATDAEIHKYYDEHKEKFKTPELWRASHILVSTEAEANELLDQLSKGASFEDLARTRSIDATAARGGDIGYFRKGQLVPEFEKACLKLSIGETSGIIHTQFGYHIIRLTGKKETSVNSYDSAKNSIQGELKKGKREELYENMITTLKNKYNVKIEDAAFNAPGTSEPAKEMVQKK